MKQSRGHGRPKLGQNFLADPSASSRIVESLGETSARTVVEIGPGKGAITTPLAQRAGRLIVIEYDTALAAKMREQFRANGNVQVVEADVLTVNFNELLPCGSGNAQALAIGNLPYYITSPILFHLFSAWECFAAAVLMVQAEVADRIVAAPGTSDYGLLSATVQMHAKAERLFTLPPSAFSPPPKIYSTVIRLTHRSRFEELQVDQAEFNNFLQIAFRHKRKTLANNLRAAGYAPDVVQRGLSAAGVDGSIRAEELSLEKAAELHRLLLRS